jgi:hypothetical protein
MYLQEFEGFFESLFWFLFIVLDGPWSTPYVINLWKWGLTIFFVHDFISLL